MEEQETKLTEVASSILQPRPPFAILRRHLCCTLTEGNGRRLAKAKNPFDSDATLWTWQEFSVFEPR
jgi:hypothetical protein